jgi:hypothetical protein
MFLNCLPCVDKLKHHITEIELAVIIVLFSVSIIKDNRCKFDTNTDNNSKTIIINNNKINDDNHICDPNKNNCKNLFRK